MKYFAYDDKMLTTIFQEILPEVRLVGIGQIKGYEIFFHNRDKADQSGKCNLIKSKDSEHVIYGVVYEVLSREKHQLDKAQSLGYGNQEITVKVMPASEGRHEQLNALTEPCYAFTYVAHKDSIFEDLEPFSWYKNLVIEGAKEHCLPEIYVHYLQAIEAAVDSNKTREQQNKQFMGNPIL
jgi:gamma-glutamylcyclotransferase